MHVCFISTSVYSYLSHGEEEQAGGAERQQYLIGKELRRRGHDVSYVTGDFVDTDCMRIDGFDVRPVLPVMGGVRRFHEKAYKLFRSIQAINADIYYVRGSYMNCILTAQICNVLGHTFAYSVASDADVLPERYGRVGLGSILQYLYVRSLNSAACLFTLTDFQKKQLKEKYGLHAKVAPVCYDLPPEGDITDHNDRSGFLWIGRIEKIKNPDVLIELAKRTPEFSYTMIGPLGSDDRLNERVLEAASNLENLSYEGYLPPGEVLEYYNHAIGVVQTTDSVAGFGNVTLEAWRYSTPVITYQSTFDGKIHDEQLGYCAEGSVESLEYGVKAIANNELAATLGWNGRAYVEANFDIADLVDMYLTCFENEHRDTLD